VVEDEVLVRMAVSEYLRECGFRVVEAGSADEAIDILKSDTIVHIVFSDVHMRAGWTASAWRNGSGANGRG